MLERQIESRLQAFKSQGGFIENMTQERLEYLREQKDASPKCPKCGSPMLRRVVKKGSRQGTEFWGCSRYPQCDGIVN